MRLPAIGLSIVRIMRSVGAGRFLASACLGLMVVIGFGAVSSLADLKLERVLDLRGVTHHVQGVDFDSRNVWATSVDSPGRKGWLHEFSLATGEQTRAVELQDGARFHPAASPPRPRPSGFRWRNIAPKAPA